VKTAFSDVELDEKEYRFVGELNSQAYTYASQTDEWKNIRSEWWICLRERGLTPREGEGDWMSEESAHLMASSQDNEESKPEEIRLATIEAECNQKVGMAQRLGDLEASYQGPLIEKNQAKLNQLKDVERPRASQAIAEARDKGDLSENAEYDAAKEAQGLLEMKIAKLEELVANARIIDESQLDVSKVLVLSTVKLKNLANKMEITYTLVAESEADLKAGKISVSSPIGKGLLGKSVGEIAEIKVPNGTLKMEILEISR